VNSLSNISLNLFSLSVDSLSFACFLYLLSRRILS